MGEIPRFYSNQENSEVTSLLGDALPASTFSSHAAAALGDEPLSLVAEESHSVDSGLEDESRLEDDSTGSSQEALDVGESDEDIFIDEEIDDAAALADNPEAALEDPLAALEADAEIASAEPISANESELDDFDSLLAEATGDAGVETPEAELEGFDELVDEETASDQDSEESAPDDPFAGLETADVPLEAAQAGVPAGDDDVDDILSEALGGDDDLESGIEAPATADAGDESWLEDDATGSSQEALDVGESDEDIFIDEEIDDAAALADNPEAALEDPLAALEADAEIASAEPISANESELDDFDSLLAEATGDAGVETPEAELEGFDELVDEETASDQDSEESAPDDPFAGLETADVPLEAAQAGAPAGDDDISNMWDEALAEQDAAEKADVEQGLGDVSSEMPDVQDEPESVSDEGELAELDDSDLESLWDEALEGSGDDDAVLDELSMEQEGESKADNEEEGESKADNEEESGSHELPAEGGDVVGQDDLDIEEGTDSGDDDEIDDEDFEPSGAADPLDDDGEIEVLIEDGDEEDEPVAAGARPEEEVREHFEETDAPFQNRLIAGLVDTLLVGFLAILFAVGTHFIIAKMVDSVYGNPESLAMVMAIDLVVLFLLSFFYAVYFIGGWGATPGLRTAGLVVVDLENRPVGYMQAVLRCFGTLAAVLPAGLGQILIVIDKRGRGLGDRLAGTKVILRASL